MTDHLPTAPQPVGATLNVLARAGAPPLIALGFDPPPGARTNQDLQWRFACLDRVLEALRTDAPAVTPSDDAEADAFCAEILRAGRDEQRCADIARRVAEACAAIEQEDDAPVG